MIITLHHDLLQIIFNVLSMVLTFFRWVVILAVAVNLLLAFGVLDMRNNIVRTIDDFLQRLTEPLLRPIRQVVRRMLPNLGGIDISPMVLLLLILVAEQLLWAIFRQIDRLLP